MRIIKKNYIKNANENMIYNVENVNLHQLDKQKKAFMLGICT